MAVKLWVLARVLEKPWEYLPYMDVRGMEYCIFSPKSEELRGKKKCISLVHIPFLCIIYMPSLWFLELLWMMICTFQWGLLLNFSGKCPCFVSSTHRRLVNLNARHQEVAYLQKASSAGVPVSQRCRENWWEEFSYFDCKIGLSGFLGYWAQFVSIVLRISLLCLWTRLGSFPFLGCHYIVVIWGDSGLIKWDRKCFIFLLEVLKWIGINSSLDIW